MKNGKTHTTSQGRSILGWMVWLLLRLTICVVIAAAAEYMPAQLKNQKPESLQTLSLIGASIFGLFSIIYFYWALRYSSSSGYRSSTWERFGLACSGVAALLMSAKLGFPHHLPGPTPAYLLAALLLAWVVRPLLDHAGWKTTGRCKS